VIDKVIARTAAGILMASRFYAAGFVGPLL